MDRAKELLMCSSMKTSEIGYEVGYKDPHYFSYIFKKETGDTVSRFIRNYRMEQRTKKLLSDTSMKIVQICKEAGFSNVSYVKNFREYCGCSPEQYRKGGMADAQTENSSFITIHSKKMLTILCLVGMLPVMILGDFTWN